MFNSIRWRIALPYILLITAITLGVGIYLTDFVHDLYRDQIQESTLNQARLVSDDLSASPLPASPTADLSQKVTRIHEILQARITIIARDGTVLADSESDPHEMENHLGRPEIQSALLEGAGQITRYSRTVRYDMFYTAVPIQRDGDPRGFVRIAIPETRISSTETRMRNTIILFSGAAGLIGILLSIFIAAQTTKPLTRLTRTAQKMARGTVDDLLDARGDDEIGQLTRAFNVLLQTLQDQIQALQKEQGKLSAVLEQMTDGVIIVNEEDEIELINPAAERLFDIRGEEAQGHTAAEVLRQHQWLELLHQSREKGAEQARSLERPGKDTFIQGIALPLGEAMPGHTLLLFQDLTRIRRLETTRQDFISNISHELRTPLASLKALTDTLQSGALEDPAAARKFLSRMDTEVDALAQMIAELLELSRIESGQVKINLETVSASALLRDAVDRMRAQAQRRQITIASDLPGSILEIKADPRRIDQVLVNLIHNAIKFSEPGGTIRVGAREDGERAVFFVEDHGAGIPAEDVPRIFERFYKTDQARSSGGTGLGLAIAKHLVENHNGQIWAESELGEGSTFYFSLPTA